jgi:hypothetical protein
MAPAPIILQLLGHLSGVRTLVIAAILIDYKPAGCLLLTLVSAC